LNVGDKPPDAVTIAVERTFSLDVVFNTNGDTTLDSQIPRQLTLVSREVIQPSTLEPQDRAAGAGFRPDAAARSRTFAPVFKGLYTLEGSSSTVTVADMRQSGKSILEDGTITVDREPADPVEIVLSKTGGTVQGTVQDSQGRPVNNAQLVLIPEGSRRTNGLLYKRTSLTLVAQGRFYFFGVTPGRYRVFAFESLPQFAERDAEFLRPFETFSRTVTVNASTTTSDITVPLIP
jgi:hypothetical protein